MVICHHLVCVSTIRSYVRIFTMRCGSFKVYGGDGRFQYLLFRAFSFSLSLSLSLFLSISRVVALRGEFR